MWAVVLLACLAGAVPRLAMAQPGISTAGALARSVDPATIDALRARIETLQSSLPAEAPDEAEAITRQRTALRDARTALDAATRELSKASDFRGQLAEVGPRIDAARQQLATPPSPPAPITPPEGADLAALEKLLAQAEGEASAARASTEEIQAESARREERRRVINETLATRRQQLADVATRITGEENSDGDASELLLRAQRAQWLAEVASLEAESELEASRADLAPLRRDLARRSQMEKEATASAWRELVAAQRAKVAARAAEDAAAQRRAAARSSPALVPLARGNEALAEARTGPNGLAARLDRARVSLAQYTTLAADLSKRFSVIVREAQQLGFARARGLRLRQYLSALPDEKTLRRELDLTRERLVDAEVELFELRERREEIGDVAAAADAALAGAAVPENDAGEVRAAARELVGARRDLMDASIADLELLVRELDGLERQLASAVSSERALRAFIEERILWVRSVPGDWRPSLRDAAGAAKWLLDPREAWRAVVRAARPSPHIAWAVMLGCMSLALLALGPRVRRALREARKPIERASTDSFSHSVRAALYTLTLAAPLPLLVWTIGAWLGAPSDQSDLGESIGAALRAGAIALGVFAIILAISRPDGLGEAHFRQPSRAVRHVRRVMIGALVFGLPAVLVVNAMDNQARDEWNASLGRLALVWGLLVLAGGLWALLRAKGGFMDEFMKRNRGGLIDRTRRVWFPILVLVPVVLAVLAMAGYQFTAFKLERRFVATLGLVLALAVLNAMLLRWLYVERRRLALHQAMERVASESSEPRENVDAESAMRLPDISAQTRQLFRTIIAVGFALGLGAIWSDVSPALRVLDRVQVYPSFQISEVDGVSATRIAPSAPTAAPNGPSIEPTPASNGAEAPASESVAMPPGTPAALLAPSTTGEEPSDAPRSVTLADVAISLVILFLVVAGARNVPGLLEITLLKRLPLDAGARYAVSTIARYIIVIVGVTLAFGSIGIGWTSIKWLAAALTFGLAFGLQEIFANFVSGLIVLLERPMRVGDTVTINGVSGTVTRVRMRATTILDWDRKELIIPNKTFITDQLINWTLSDTTLRVVIPVGVAYGSDTAMVERTLLEVARAHPLIMREPGPYVIFQGFGDSTLNFELRVFIPHLDHLLNVRHQTNLAIERTFREAGIEIAFPQRGLHIRSAPGLEGLILARAADGTPEARPAPPTGGPSA